LIGSNISKLINFPWKRPEHWPAVVAGRVAVSD
jgi:hypothetical protein